MEHAFQILVVVLSIVLTVFLILGIIAISFVIKLVQQLRSIASRGDVIAEQAQHFTSNIAANANAMGLLKSLTTIVSIIKRK